MNWRTSAGSASDADQMMPRVWSAKYRRPSVHTAPPMMALPCGSGSGLTTPLCGYRSQDVASPSPAALQPRLGGLVALGTNRLISSHERAPTSNSMSCPAWRIIEYGWRMPRATIRGGAERSASGMRTILPLSDAGFWPTSGLWASSPVPM